MKVRVLKDSKGNILATMELAFNDAYVDVVAENGNRVEEMEVPEDYVLNLEKLYKTEKK
jgi:hypothetical protein